MILMKNKDYSYIFIRIERSLAICFKYKKDFSYKFFLDLATGGFPVRLQPVVFGPSFTQ